MIITTDRFGPRPIEDKSGFVYVLMLLAPEGPVFKIGKARNVSLRMDQIQPLLPYESIVAFSFWTLDALGQEAYMHRYYAEYRLLGEWFRLPLSALFHLEELGKLMHASTPAWALQETAPRNWRRRLSFNAPELLARLRREFPNESWEEAA